MAKIKLWKDRRIFFCPGCKTDHHTNMGWVFNGDMEKPALSPSILHKQRSGNDIQSSFQCHSYIESGMIRFLDDCFHELKGQTVPLPDWVDPVPNIYEGE